MGKVVFYDFQKQVEADIIRQELDENTECIESLMEATEALQEQNRNLMGLLEEMYKKIFELEEQLIITGLKK